MLEPTIEKLTALRLGNMALAVREMETQKSQVELSWQERLGLIVDQEWQARENRRLVKRLKEAKLTKKGVAGECHRRPGARARPSRTQGALLVSLARDASQYHPGGSHGHGQELPCCSARRAGVQERLPGTAPANAPPLRGARDRQGSREVRRSPTAPGAV